MQPEARKLLAGRRSAAEQVWRFTRGRTLADYTADQPLRWPVERGFKIIGEALSQPAKPDLAWTRRIREYRKLISFRNILIQGYGQVNHATMWDTLQQDLPRLRREWDERL